MQRKLQQALDEVNQNLIQDLTDEQAGHTTGGGIVPPLLIIYSGNTASTRDRTRNSFVTGGWGAQLKADIEYNINASF